MPWWIMPIIFGAIIFWIVIFFIFVALLKRVSKEYQQWKPDKELDCKVKEAKIRYYEQLIKESKSKNEDNEKHIDDRIDELQNEYEEIKRKSKESEDIYDSACGW